MTKMNLYKFATQISDIEYFFPILELLVEVSGDRCLKHEFTVMSHDNILVTVELRAKGVFQESTLPISAAKQ